MQKAKEAKTVGILVGTLGAGKVFCACTLQYDSVCTLCNGSSCFTVQVKIKFPVRIRRTLIVLP